MSTKIRLRRMGKKKQPFYRIVVTDSRAARDSRAVEEIGTYNPVTRPGRINVQEDRVFEWLGRGAQPSDTVGSLFRRIGIMKKWSLAKAGQDTSAIEIKTELVETAKPARRGKKAKAAEGAEVAEAPAETKTEAKAEAKAEAEAASEPAERGEPESAPAPEAAAETEKPKEGDA